MANIVDFYSRVINTIGMGVDKNGFIYVGKGDAKVILVVNNKTLVIPTKEHLKTMVEKNEDGELEVTKVPFNPLNEDVVKGDSVSLKRTKIAVEKHLGHALASVGELLLLLGQDKTQQSKTSLDVNKFLKLINSVKTPQNSSRGNKVVDERMVENWDKLYSETLKSQEGIIKISLIKGGKKDGIKYNRVASLISPLYDMLLEADTETPVLGVKLRKKDIELFKQMLEYLIPGIEENRVIQVASNDKVSPAFISLMKLYLTHMERYNKINRELQHINQSTADSGYIELTVTEQEIEDLSIYKAELNTIPDEHDINRDMVKKKQTTITQIDPNVFNTAPIVKTGNPILDDAAMSARQTQQVVQQPYMQQPAMPAYQQPVMQQPVQQIDPVIAAANQTLTMGNGIYPMQPYGGYGMQGPGYNTFNNYVQPTYNRPNPYITPAPGYNRPPW